MGVSILLCGGGEPYFGSFFRVNRFKRNMKMYFYTESGDFLYRQAIDTYRFYAKHIGTKNIIGDFPEGQGHCALDIQTQVTLGLKALKFIDS